jgi:hypothetical protein
MIMILLKHRICILKHLGACYAAQNNCMDKPSLKVMYHECCFDWQVWLYARVATEEQQKKLANFFLGVFKKSRLSENSKSILDDAEAALKGRKVKAKSKKQKRTFYRSDLSYFGSYVNKLSNYKQHKDKDRANSLSIAVLVTPVPARSLRDNFNKQFTWGEVRENLIRLGYGKRVSSRKKSNKKLGAYVMIRLKHRASVLRGLGACTPAVREVRGNTSLRSLYEDCILEWKVWLVARVGTLTQRKKLARYLLSSLLKSIKCNWTSYDRRVIGKIRAKLKNRNAANCATRQSSCTAIAYISKFTENIYNTHTKSDLVRYAAYISYPARFLEHTTNGVRSTDVFLKTFPWKMVRENLIRLGYGKRVNATPKLGKLSASFYACPRISIDLFAGCINWKILKLVGIRTSRRETVTQKQNQVAR